MHMVTLVSYIKANFKCLDRSILNVGTKQSKIVHMVLAEEMETIRGLIF